MTLALQGVTVTFPDGSRTRNVLRDITWQCDRGQVSVLMGPSGAGKSTILSVISTEVEPNSGAVSYDDVPYTSLPRRQRDAFRRAHIAQIFQDYTLLDALTAVENVALGCELRGMSSREARKRASGAMELLHLGEVREAFPVTLSGGGERQRVAIARCLISDADVILADEPTGALDDEMTKDVCRALRQLADSGKHVIVVTHDREVAMTGDRIVRLAGGTLSS